LGEVYQDTLAMCASVIPHAKEPKLPGLDEVLAEVVSGRLPFAEHLFAEDFTWNELRCGLGLAAMAFTAVVQENISTDRFHAAIQEEVGQGMEYYWKKVAEWGGKDYF